MRAKLALAVIVVTGLMAVTHPADAKTAAGDGALAVGALAGLALLAVAAVCFRRCRPAGWPRRPLALPRVAACPAGPVTVHTPAGWPRRAPHCAAACGRPASVIVVFPDGRPGQPSCAGCWRDTAASEARAAGRRMPAPAAADVPAGTPAAADNQAPSGADPDFERVMREARLNPGG